MAIRGTVVRLEPAHGFGFIRDDCGGEWFFVGGGVRTRALDTLWLDERVLFEQEWTPGGPRATDVRNEYAA
jgi:cold shock CspA family protein